jgi:hypothetical protein
MTFIFGLAIGLAVGWIVLPRPQWVTDLLAKLGIGGA